MQLIDESIDCSIIVSMLLSSLITISSMRTVTECLRMPDYIEYLQAANTPNWESRLA